VRVSPVWCVVVAVALATSLGADEAPAQPRKVKRKQPAATVRRPTLRQADADGGRHWARWAVIGAGVAAAGAATYAILTRNHPPTAGTIEVSPNERGMAGVTTFTLTAAGSSDPDGDSLRYAWSLGDGSQADGPQVTHVYTNPGTYTIALTVSDGRLPAVAQPALVTVERNLAGTWSGGHALPLMNPLRLELLHDTTGLTGTLVAEPYRGTPGGTSPLAGRLEHESYPCHVTWSTVLLGVITVRFDGSVASAESGVMTGTITVEQPGEFSNTGTTTFRR
jgi:hypothetical protein